MGQTNIFRLCQSSKKLMLCIMLLLFTCVTSIVLADVPVQNVAVETNFGGNATNNRLNGAANIGLKVTWQGDSTPFTVRYKRNGAIILSDSSINQGSHETSISAANWGDTNGTAEQVTVEVVDNGQRNSTGQSLAFIVDTLSPELTATVVNAPFSQNSTVRIQIQSNETVTIDSVTCNNVSASLEGNITTSQSFVYNLPLNDSFTNGVEYTVDIKAHDATIPENGANRGSTTVKFKVGTSAQGSTSITGCTPASPTNAASIELSGTSPDGVSRLRILDKGTEVTTVSCSQTSWKVVLQPEPGDHTYVAVSLDSLDQEISRSQEYSIVIDREAPKTPTYSTEGIPTQTNATSYKFKVTVDDYTSEKSLPITVKAYNNDTEQPGQAIISTNTGGSADIDVSLNPGTNNIYFRSFDAAGNQSEKSAQVTINQSGEATGGISSILIDNAYPVPAPESVMFGSGNHSMQITFSQDCNRSTPPTVEIICSGGGKISVSTSWLEGNSRVASGSFSIPNNGGASIDGPAQISIKDVKDTYGNTLSPHTTDPSSLKIDSTAPTSSFTNPSPVYVSDAQPTVTLQGNIVDNDNSSGIDYLELYLNDNGQPSLVGNVPLQTGNPSPWSYSYTPDGLSEGEHTLITSAVDKAVPNGNKESLTGKTGITLFIDKAKPGIERISFNNTGVDITTSYGDNPTIASDITRLVLVASDTGSGPDLTSTNFIFKLTNPTGTEVTGEKTNNNQDTIYFDFPVLTASGEYTITATPVDKAGNTGETKTVKFTLNKSAPDTAEFFPPAQSVANKSDQDLASSSVRVTLSGSPVTGGTAPSYAGSTISVKYNGVEVGEKRDDITDALVAKIHNGNLLEDGSHDGNYYISVTPRSTTGIAGTAITSSFIYDTLPPVIIESNPSYDDPTVNTASGVWFGLNTSELSITMSDAPKDILEKYRGQYPETASSPVMPGDTSWYNSNGSGINKTVSSFTWLFPAAGGPPTSHKIEGNKFSVSRPPVPTDTTTGVVNFTPTIILADNVTVGTTVPNMYRFEKIYRFDYLKPKIELITQNGQKFCKNLLSVVAKAEDQGSDNDLLVTKIEYTEANDLNNAIWKELEVDKLPSKTATFTLNIDISQKDEGNFKVYFRAVDRAGNTSDAKEFTYTVDRTPPSPPDLTIPLADYTVNKRNQSFKWNSVTDASAYLIQIADDSSFNNVLNHISNQEYTGLKGNIKTTLEESFSLPKDGTYYWRVASLEKCADGFNISEFSPTRKLIIDTVKPYIVSITPTPSSSNSISTGMVTFNIRFNEAIDSTMDVSATLTSAGGQVMKIEKVSCSGDTWVGTTVIPKNNSAVYDGNAVIAVESATDLAGNAMLADNSHTIVVNTGPAFTTKLFSNPANEYEITIITRSSESLQTAPSVSVKQNSVSTPVTMNFLKDRFYSGSYKIDKENPGSAYINISGTDLYGKVGTNIVEFIIADVNASARLNITSSSGRASLKAAESSTYTPTAVYIIDRESLESPFSVTKESTVNASVSASAGVSTKTSQKKNSELVGVLGLDEIGPSSVKLKKCMLYTADVNGENIDTSSMDKIHIYRQDANGNWVFQGGELNNYKISAQITGLGRLALMADKTAPRMSSLTPSNEAKLNTNLPEIKGQFVDNGSGLVTDSFKLYIDDIQIKDVEMNKDGSFSYQVKQILKKGKHEIKCEVSDKAGNSIVRAVTVNAPNPISLGEFRPYPSPARGNHISFAFNFGATPDSASLKIYDSAGHMVAKFGPEDFDRATGIVRWDLLNKKGKRIANGTYIYRLEVHANGQKISRRGKFAVLR
ncbi:MAG: hypothetical protein IKO19_12455 [Candidatus Riflebacteria bacterium]|nr:hypothetical protein [Candidatus Riflebacteria bacterium]